MKSLLPVLLLWCGVSAMGAEQNVLQDIADLQWKNRVIVARLADRTEPGIALLEKASEQVHDRDILWFFLQGERVATNYEGQLGEHYVDSMRAKFSGSAKNVLLIGKDGGIKYQSERLDLDTIFALIDTMPMRQLEMNR